MWLFIAEIKNVVDKSLVKEVIKIWGKGGQKKIYNKHKVILQICFISGW